MDERFTCRNKHHWRLWLDGSSPFNPRWIACPSCGAPPVPAQPLPLRHRLSAWLQRNPQLGLLASILVLLATAAMLAFALWKERDLLKTSRADAPMQQRR